MKVAVLGSGTMGSGIVSTFAQQNSIDQILWWGRTPSQLSLKLPKITKDIYKTLKRQNLAPEKAESMAAKITVIEKFDQLNDTDFVIEAIVENFEKKQALFTAISEHLPSSAILATNTSSLSITALSIYTHTPSNFIGMHFFNPIGMMELVEVIKGLQTSDGTLNFVRNFAASLNKSPVLVEESPGFIVNRMLIPMINEAVSVLAEGVASKEDIDKAMKLGANHPLGPLALADLIGNNVCLSIMETLHAETGDPKYRAHLKKSMVTALPLQQNVSRKLVRS
ncbi:3-hydroxyacyl-CoA dehydrogenase family protein [Alteromonas gilva]|uniref:3-hydroxyacyl-CoA dehydrogenase NAD-binding domain-containing protein n=1 Tax=Alteromonas gilva TaxID=2987522 RepID=A0ABT5L0C2_9ALTE|nr:3-hydroxyacyl-CoA dehydrogenase NAD-binding domain-containing protein [Alteromonas gilva]MDC8830479.1 3-hydroxyacyl-CoA dehydrogenase NAD-binding domain-containing protein [Alteromonas gilva]